MTEVEHLAKLAYQSGEKALQRGWWDYVKSRATELGIEIAEVLGEIERLKSSAELPRNGA
jgi:hypothetical protein